jgi:hypothetical protein
MSAGFGGKDANFPLVEVTLVHEDPDRDDIKFPYSLFQNSRAVRVGNKCWLTGVPDEAVTSGRVNCSSFGSSDTPDVPGMLASLTMPGTVKRHNGSLEFVPRDSVAFLRALDFKTTPAPKAGATSVRVEIQMSGADLRSVSVAVVGGPEPTLAVNMRLSVSRVNRVTVAMPRALPPCSVLDSIRPRWQPESPRQVRRRPNRPAGLTKLQTTPGKLSAWRSAQWPEAHNGRSLSTH